MSQSKSAAIPLARSACVTWQVLPEWVYDWYDTNWYTQQLNTGTIPNNPTGPVAGTERVIRGGSWNGLPFFARSVHRLSGNPARYYLWAGFHCADDVAIPQQQPLPPPDNAANNTNLTGAPTPLAVTGTVDPATLGLAPNTNNGGGQPTIPPALPTATLPAGDTQGTSLPPGS
ncbi:MAG: hypothetical protein U0694_08735 [Anaerolineae bacterium]